MRMWSIWWEGDMEDKYKVWKHYLIRNFAWKFYIEVETRFSFEISNYSNRAQLREHLAVIQKLSSILVRSLFGVI